MNARHPAAGTLFSLFMSTDEARAALAPAYIALNTRSGYLPLDVQIRQSLADGNTKLVDWFSTPEARTLLDWLAQPRGNEYQER